MNPLKLKINLLSKEELEERTLNKFLQWTLTFGRYIIVGTEIIVLVVFFSRFKLDRELVDLHEQIKQKEAIVKFNHEFEKKARTIQNQLKEIKTLEENHDFTLKLLGFFEKNLPKDVGLERVSFSKKKLSLKGISLSTASFIDFLARLRTSPRFSQVVLKDLTKTEDEGLKFNLTVQVNQKSFEENLR